MQLFFFLFALRLKWHFIVTFSLLVNLPAFVTNLDEPSALKWHQAGAEVTQHAKQPHVKKQNNKQKLILNIQKSLNMNIAANQENVETLQLFMLQLNVCLL